MASKTIKLGTNTIQSDIPKIAGSFVDIDKERFYKIANYNAMPDFFMSIVSDSDHFMFISSNGALTAGRKNKNNALFPYYTDDKIHDYRDITGSITSMLVTRENITTLWEPFTQESERVYRIKRNLYKNTFGNKLIFEEINEDLGLNFRYGWYNSDKFGIIKRSSITNLGDKTLEVEILDGIRNILPAGVDYAFQNEFSNLLDAYKKNELIENTTLGIFALSSIPADRPEPSEALKASTVWSEGLAGNKKILLSDRQVKAFTQGLPVKTETDIRAARGAYYICGQVALDPGSSEDWFLAAEVNQDSSDIATLAKLLAEKASLVSQVLADIKAGTKALQRIVGKSDGIQLSNEELLTARHFSNSLFNIMRGGIFPNNYKIDRDDLILYFKQTNLDVYKKYKTWISNLEAELEYQNLLDAAVKKQDPDLQRICIEYFPLTFSRRHGDPSRPWNYFSIENRNPDGSPKLHYEGNWRDIFQNWEALSISYPAYLEGMISKFANASTPDGYNPYRITREGLDWEIHDPDEPWAFIGYWGDHQVIYLQKFLELTAAFHPGKFHTLLTQDSFVYANVPYRLKSFEEIKKDPKNTIDFDFGLHNELIKKSEIIGADGKLLRNAKSEIVYANLTEKLLVMLLSKLSNFIPEAGIWLNTQRPEWNDANNALVGSGVSMVTLYYIRRFLKFWIDQLEQISEEKVSLAAEIYDFLEEVFTTFKDKTHLLEGGFSNEERGSLCKTLGKAGSKYRSIVYKSGFSEKRKETSFADLKAFLQTTLLYMDQSIRANKRSDGLFHAYNLISFDGDAVSIRHLYEMLEGQVAVLSAGFLSVEESLDVLDALKASNIFREDQYSYMLYPDRELTRFNEKNNIPDAQVRNSKLIRKLLDTKNIDIVKADSSDHLHFNSSFKNAGFLEAALDSLDKDEYGDLVTKEKSLILNIYEEMFDHQSFTGRSGTFYGYEGLGSIYWHMVSKLLLACQECYLRGENEAVDRGTIDRLKDHYYEIKAGIGLYKSPGLYGAFPTDAYSHTPANSGVKQPGLTGQVKEDIISRFGELGLKVENGEIAFSPTLLNPNEFLEKDGEFRYIDLDGEEAILNLKAGQLGFTFCQTPIVFSKGLESKILLHKKDGESIEIPGNRIPQEESRKVLARDNQIKAIDYVGYNSNTIN